MADLGLVANPNKALWEKGDFSRIAETMRESGEHFVESLGIEPGLDVLDLGSGDGTTALPAAMRGAKVLAIDIASNLVAAGNLRAKAAGLSNIHFREGDASDLRGVANSSFDLVVSIFGAMFAPSPYDVAREMVRVTKPGGRIVMGNWIQDDPTLVAQILKISAAYMPPPPEGFVSPMSWGNEEDVRSRFVASGIDERSIDFGRETWHFRYSGMPAELLSIFRHYYGPTMNAFEAAVQTNRLGQLHDEMLHLFNVSNEAESETSIPATFLKVVATKR